MEIERKFLIDRLPEDLTRYTCHNIQQAYLCTDPVIRIRRQDDDYILTYKSKGFLAREEYNLPLNQESYRHLLEKADGIILSKKRWLIPLQDDLTAELDVFAAPYEGLYLAEVEFPSKEAAEAFTPPSWFGEEVTYSPLYHNSTLSLPTAERGMNMNDKRLNDMRLLGLTIAYYRRIRGLTQMELAEAVHISRTHISNIEAPGSKTSLSLNKLFDIAEALEVPVKNLFDFQNTSL